MAERGQAPGCRDAALATLLLVGFAAMFIAVGLTLVNQPGCEGLCETSALTLLYAGGPVSALIGVVFGGIFFAWPLDVTLWVVSGFLLARRNRGATRDTLGVALAVLAVALIYGLVLSQLVEIA